MVYYVEYREEGSKEVKNKKVKKNLASDEHNRRAIVAELFAENKIVLKVRIADGPGEALV